MHLGAKQLKNPDLEKWTEPLFEAFLNGAWMLHWTEDTIYWLAKPNVYVERSAEGRRVHREKAPALESDLEDFWFWQGVLVTQQIVESPETLTPAQIMSEENDQVRMVMIERYGFDRFILDGQAKELDRVGEYRLLSIPDQAWGNIKAVKMVCPSTGAAFVIPVDPRHENVSSALDDIKGVRNYLQRITQQT